MNNDYSAYGEFHYTILNSPYVHIKKGKNMSQSKNHQYLDYADHVVARYVKTVTHSITGMRLDPTTAQPVDFFLSTPDKNFDFGSKEIVDFSDDDEVLELYSEKEVTYFKRSNKYLIENGLIKPYTGTKKTINEENVLDDSEIEEIASITNLPKLRSRVHTLTSTVTLTRVLNSMKDLGRKESIRQVVADRIKELEQ